VCFLAYVLWKTLEQWQSRAGLGNSPRTIFQELAAIQSTDIILPTATASPRELRLRCVVRPTAPSQPCSIASDCTCQKGCACNSPDAKHRM
jgi:hypothetical protein